MVYAHPLSSSSLADSKICCTARGIMPISSGLSIFSSEEVLALVQGAQNSDFHVIGFSAGGSCLATIFSGFDLGIHLTLVDDAIGASGVGAATLEGIAEITAPLCATIGSADLIRYMERAHAEDR